jgi:acyl-CoA thioesterase-1
MSVVKVLICVALVLVIVGVVISRHKSINIQTKKVVSVPGVISYLPLGDSYTIGQSVSEQDRWPNQLVNLLATQGKRLHIVANPSVTGYTSQDLIDQELPLVTQLKPDFVTVLIGVNDYVQDVPIKTFQTNLEYIVTTLQKEMPEPQNILFVTIPDFSKTPTGAEFGPPATLEAGVEAFNAVIKQVAGTYKLPVADIFPVSQQVANDPSLIANDGLHPSGKEYTAWTKVIDDTIKNSDLLQSPKKQ